MSAKKETPKVKVPKQEPFLRCGDCDEKLPADAVKCPKCGYDL